MYYICNLLCNVLYMQCTIYVITMQCTMQIMILLPRKYAFPPPIMLLCFIPCPINIIPQKNYDYHY